MQHDSQTATSERYSNRGRPLTERDLKPILTAMRKIAGRNGRTKVWSKMTSAERETIKRAFDYMNNVSGDLFIMVCSTNKAINERLAMMLVVRFTSDDEIVITADGRMSDDADDLPFIVPSDSTYFEF